MDEEELSFKNRFRENPIDAGTFRAYADWLLERGRLDDYECLRFIYYLTKKSYSKRCPTTYPPEDFAEEFREYIDGIDSWRVS